MRKLDGRVETLGHGNFLVTFNFQKIEYAHEWAAHDKIRKSGYRAMGSFSQKLAGNRRNFSIILQLVNQ